MSASPLNTSFLQLGGIKTTAGWTLHFQPAAVFFNQPFCYLTTTFLPLTM